MKLFEHPDFEQAIIHAAEHFQALGLRQAMIEKDYYVTEALRIVQQVAGDKVIFKGGTSLSKGWNLIQRFSEDIDIFLDPIAFSPSLGKNAINRELKEVKNKIEIHPGLRFVEEESKTIGGFGRCDYFKYTPKFVSAGDIKNRVFVEIGTASGREPKEVVKIQSYLSQYLQEIGISLGADDESSFEMNLLHFRRTFVEKMFAIHSKVEAFKKSGIGIGGYARHYYDLFCLSKKSEVLEMLKSNEYASIKSDYDQVSKKYFKASYLAPVNMSFSNSDALFPDDNLDRIIGAEFERQCKILCFGKFPTWREVQSRFLELKEVL